MKRIHQITRNYLEEKVEGKINEIMPRPQRVRRGLINAVGSIFITVAGVLDEDDGKRYNKLIQDFQNNKNKLAVSVKNLTITLINEFNNTTK